MGEEKTALIPNPDFRPNPSRAIFIQGIIDQKLVDQVTSKIIELQNINRDPITVYIDSLGGNTTSADTIRRLLLASDQDNHPPCRIITVVTARAASAAADLLFFGDYAVAYPESFILYHGLRHLPPDPVTADDVSYIAQNLKSGNERFAMELANRSNERWIFRYLTLKPLFKKDKSDIDCFIDIISSKLSSKGKEILNKSLERHARYARLITIIDWERKFRNFADFEGHILKKLLIMN
ncbi:MAG: hypothetical protein D084_Lepto4C00027G0001 [Leptospirillum sp. Group IV 'UBA BS']|nr:MAG: hypothetical protein D084_Lepto4C00027G0001 [Leptospirillum sp. Group IV 'UBA BS']